MTEQRKRLTAEVIERAVWGGGYALVAVVMAMNLGGTERWLGVPAAVSLCAAKNWLATKVGPQDTLILVHLLRAIAKGLGTAADVVVGPTQDATTPSTLIGAPREALPAADAASEPASEPQDHEADLRPEFMRRPMHEGD